MIGSIRVHTRLSTTGLPAAFLDFFSKTYCPRHLAKLFSSSGTAKVMVSTRSQRKRPASPVEAVAIVKAEEDSSALSDIASPPKKARKTKGKAAAKVKKEESEDEFVPPPVDEAATPAPKGKAKVAPTPKSVKSVKEDNDGLGPKPAKTAGVHPRPSRSI